MPRFADRARIFVAAGAGCTMRFAHGGWTEANASARPKFGDWGVILERFVALCPGVTGSDRG